MLFRFLASRVGCIDDRKCQMVRNVAPPVGILSRESNGTISQLILANDVKIYFFIAPEGGSSKMELNFSRNVLLNVVLYYLVQY